MTISAIFLRGLSRQQLLKAGLLSSWFFVTVATLWLLKPVRVASLLAHLGAAETPYVRLAGVATVAVVVMAYSAVVNRLTRINVVRWSSALFMLVLIGFWIAVHLGGAWLGAQRAFVWAVYIMVEIYSVVMIGIFWTYTNDVVTTEESNKLYGVIGLGGILGGAAGGAFVDLFAKKTGPINLLLVCAALVLASAGIASATEKLLHPPERRVEDKEEDGFAVALSGAKEALKSGYLMLLVGIVVAYEFTATLTDFGINVIFERAYLDEGELAKMYGRLGWIVSATAIAGQLILVPLLLPKKRLALLVPPIVMIAGAIGVMIIPVVATAMVLAAADRGINYSIHQVVKESLYVPLSDAQKYKAKAFIDMFVDRAAKAMAAFVLIAIIHYWGESVEMSVGAAFISMLVWGFAAWRLGGFWKGARVVAKQNPESTKHPSQEPAKVLRPKSVTS